MHEEKSFSLDVTAEEGILLLTGARLLDKLVAGISIHASDRDELIKAVINKLSDRMPAALSGLAEEIAAAVVESVLGCLDVEDEEILGEIERRGGAGDDLEEMGSHYPMYSIETTLPLLEEAVIEHRTVRVRYYSFAREAIDQLTLDPHALLREDELWKMVAFCHEYQQSMVFRVDRIKDVAHTTGRFQVPANHSVRRQLPFAS